jgi:amino acid transporter
MECVGATVSLESMVGAGLLHRKLSAFGVLLLTLSCNSPVYSIYGFGTDILQQAGTGAAGLFLLGVGAAAVWAVVYAELSSAYPYAGGEYVGVGSILGPWAGVASLTILAVTLGPILAFLAKTLAPYALDLMPGANASLVTFGALGVAVVLALLGVRTNAVVTGILLAIEMLAVFALTIAGFWHPVRSFGSVIAHPVALMSSVGLAPVAFGSMALAAVSAAYATVGGQQAIPFGEELMEPHRHMGRVVLVAGLIGAIGTAVPIIAVVTGAADLAAVLRSPAPCSTFFASIAGPAAGRALSAAVAVAVFNALIALTMFSARVYFSLGRDRLFGSRLNRILATVHGASGSPRSATLIIGAIAGLCCMLDFHWLVVFLSGSVVFTLTLASCAVLVGRKKGLTGQAGYWRSPLFPLAPVLGLCLAGAFAVADLLDADVGRPSIILLGSIILMALLWHHMILKRRAGGWVPRLGETARVTDSAPAHS